MSKEDSPGHGDDVEENSGTVRRQYDWTTKEPSIAVAETVGIAADSEPNDLEPLYCHVDPESLDAIIAPGMTSRTETTNSISFPYNGFEITVRSDGEVRVSRRDDDVSLHRRNEARD